MFRKVLHDGELWLADPPVMLVASNDCHIMWRVLKIALCRRAFPYQRHITSDATEELKLDGYRALAIKTGGRVKFRSRNDNDFNGRYPDIVNALSAMPDETVIDGEVVALD